MNNYILIKKVNINLMKILHFFILLFLASSVFADDLNTFQKNQEWTPAERAYIKNHPILNVPNFKAFTPFNFNENGIPMGYSVDYLNLIAKYIGVKIHYIQGKNWGQSLNMLKTGKLDIIPHIAESLERKKYISFTSFDHIEYTTGFAVSADSKSKSIDDLKDQVIAVNNKTFIHDYLKKYYPNQKLLLTTSTNAAIDAVSLGKAEAAIGSLPVMYYHIQKKWLSNIKFIDPGDLNQPVKLKIGVSNKNPILLSIIEKAHKMVSHSEDASLKEKWRSGSKETNDAKFTPSEVSYLVNKKEIKLCINPHWPPLEQMKNGKYVGITAEYFHIFQNNLPISIKFIKTANFKQMLTFAKEGRCDVISMLSITQNNPINISLSKSYVHMPRILVARSNTPFIDNIHNIKNKKIGILEGAIHDKSFHKKYPNLNIIQVSTVKKGLQMVSDKELFGFIAPLPLAALLIQDSYIGKIKIAGKFKKDESFYLGILNEDPELLSIFNKLIDSVHQDKRQEILNTFTTLKINSSIDYSHLLYISFFFLILIAVVLYKNRSIKWINKKLITAHHKMSEQQKMVNKYVMIIETDLLGMITEANKAYCDCLEYKSDELVGQHYKKVHHSKMSDAVISEMLLVIINDGSWTGEISLFTKHDLLKYLNTYIDPIFKNGKRIGYRAIFEDITDKKHVEELSITDKLTGIYNRLRLDQLILEQVNNNNRYKLVFSIILIDVDNFKKINDTYGHDIGDKVLQEISSYLQYNTRSTDYFGRWGGEEFLIICPNTNASDTFILSEKIRSFIEKKVISEVGPITVSSGVTEFIKDDTVNSIFKRADKALYQAKTLDKNNTVCL